MGFNIPNGASYIAVNAATAATTSAVSCSSAGFKSGTFLTGNITYFTSA
jgi:hypothetical protein